MNAPQTLLTVGGYEDPLLPKLIQAINYAQEIEVAVSFVRNSGYKLLSGALIDALERGAAIRLLTSDYLNVTEPTALRSLMLLKERGADIRIHRHDGSQSFHMKSYIFVRSQDDDLTAGCAFVGSSNISRAALTTGYEWNLCLACHGDSSDPYVQQFAHIRRQFANIFHHELSESLSHLWIDNYLTRYKPTSFIAAQELTAEDLDDLEISPTSVQQEALAALNQSREEGYRRGLVVLATGLGKTWLAAFDSIQCHAQRVLFVAHREEILFQAEDTFIRIRSNDRTGFYNGAEQSADSDLLFASVQTIGKINHLRKFAPDHFDYIIVDEFHHASATTYRNLLTHFQPKFLLGLTATPERTDQADILSLCDNNLVFERDLVYGINANLLAPFHYFGIEDKFVKYEEIPWRNGKFLTEELTNNLATHRRARHVLEHWQEKKQSRTLAFCISKRHADFMAEAFTKAGYTTAAVYSGSAIPRNEALQRLASGQLDIIFSIDLFNEGTDLPAIDTVLMLRPTESKIIFLQQLGRGLRRHNSKAHLVVIDFIGNHQSFLLKPLTLHSCHSAKQAVQAAIQPSGTLPNGCFTNYEPAVIDLLEQMARSQRNNIVDEYQTLKSVLGYRPTATEFYHTLAEVGINFNTVRQQHKSWFEFVMSQGDLSKEEATVVGQFKDFLLSAVEKTSMAKSFKMILLEAFIELDGFNNPPSEQALAERSWLILQRRPDLVAKDLPEKLRQLKANSNGWLKYWRGNPVKAFTGGNEPWFCISENHFMFSSTIPNQNISFLLTRLILELISLRLGQYKNR